MSPQPTLSPRMKAMFGCERPLTLVSSCAQVKGLTGRPPGPPVLNVLLPRHGDAEAFLGRDVMIGILGVVAEIDLHPVDLSVEPAGVSGVVRADRRARLIADICGLIRREHEP